MLHRSGRECIGLKAIAIAHQMTYEAEIDGARDVHVERLVSEVESRYSREQIEWSVQEAAARYKDARVTALIPILV